MLNPSPLCRVGRIGLLAVAVVLCVAKLSAQDVSETPAPSVIPTAAPTDSATETPAVAEPSTAQIPSPAQTLLPAPTPALAPAAPPRLLYPSAAGANLAKADQGSGAATTANLAVTFLVLAGLCAGGYYFLRRQPGFAPGFKGGTRKLNVSESRSLGNRQFLVVVEYENERMLLGVTPGKIDYLCPLRGPGTDGSVFPVPGGAST